MSSTGARSVIVVFGCKVRPDGTPSGCLRRRTLGALAWARARVTAPLFVVSGGAGDGMHVEASVMRELLLAHGADPADILMDTAANDTLQNVVNSLALVDQLAHRCPVGDVFVASDDYHVPRCWLLMSLARRGRAAHRRTRPIWVRGSRRAVGTRTWLRYCWHEAAATVRDAKGLETASVSPAKASDQTDADRLRRSPRAAG